MKYFEVSIHQRRLDNLFEQIDKIPQDPELLSHWARYLCVLSSGFLEIAVRIIYGRYASAKSEPRVAKFVDRQLKLHFQNLDMERLVQLANSFSPDWAAELEKKCAGELEASVNSIISNRNRIAHGEDVPGLTYGRIRDYYSNLTKVIQLLENQCQ